MQHVNKSYIETFENKQDSGSLGICCHFLAEKQIQSHLSGCKINLIWFVWTCMTKLAWVVVGNLYIGILFSNIWFITLSSVFDFEDAIMESIKCMLFSNRKIVQHSCFDQG